MINPEIPLETRLYDNSNPLVAQSIANIITNHEYLLEDDEIEALRQAIVLIAAVRQAIDNRKAVRTRSLQLTEKGQIGFEANKTGKTISLLGSFPKEGSSTSTAEGQEIIIRRKDQSCEVLVVDPVPLG